MQEKLLNKYVTKFKFILPDSGQANNLRDDLLSQEIVTYLESQQTEEMVDYCPKLSCPGLNANFFCRTK